jgi:hypothetical protein
VGQKSRLKVERKRNVTEFVFKDGDKKAYIQEIHPANTAPSTDVSSVTWTHGVGVKALPEVIGEIVARLPKKRIYILHSGGSKAVIGVKPELTEKEQEFMAKLTERFRRRLTDD